MEDCGRQAARRLHPGQLAGAEPREAARQCRSGPDVHRHRQGEPLPPPSAGPFRLIRDVSFWLRLVCLLIKNHQTMWIVP